MFTQRWFLTEFQFDLTAVDVRVREKGLTYSRSYRVPYENIPTEPVEVDFSSKPRLAVALVLGLLAFVLGMDTLVGGKAEDMAWAFYGFFALLAAVWYLSSRQSYFVFNAGDPALVVMKYRPTREAVTAFLADLQEHRGNYFGQQYVSPRASRSAADTIEKLYWLQQQGAISGAEYEALKARIVGEPGERPFPPTMH